jgi:hypothetical protein
VELPDARLYRFTIDAGGRLWLYDLISATRREPALAAAHHLKLAKELYYEVQRRVPELALLPDARPRVGAASELSVLLSTLSSLWLAQCRFGPSPSPP